MSEDKNTSNNGLESLFGCLCILIIIVISICIFPYWGKFIFFTKKYEPLFINNELYLIEIHSGNTYKYIEQTRKLDKFEVKESKYQYLTSPEKNQSLYDKYKQRKRDPLGVLD